MPGASEVRAGGAYVELLTKDTSLSKGLSTAQKTLDNAGKVMMHAGLQIAATGAAISAPMAAAAEVFQSVGSEIEHASERTGIAVDTLSRLKYAADQNNVAFESLETGVKRMQKALYEAERGSKPINEALQQLGLTTKDLAGIPADKQLGKIADGLKSIEDPGTRAALSMVLLGRSGTELLPILEQGSDGIDKITAKADKLGVTMSESSAKGAARLEEAQKDLKSAFVGLSDQIGEAVAPSMERYSGLITTILPQIGQMVASHRGLVAAIFEGGSALTGLGGALTAAGGALRGFREVAGAASTIMGALRVSVNGVATAANYLYTGLLSANPVVLGLAAAATAAGIVVAALASNIKKVREESEALVNAKAAFKNIGSAEISAQDAQKRLDDSGRTPEQHVKDAEDLVSAQEQILSLQKQIRDAAVGTRGASAAQSNLDSAQSDLAAAQEELKRQKDGVEFDNAHADNKPTKEFNETSKRELDFFKELAKQKKEHDKEIWDQEKAFYGDLSRQKKKDDEDRAREKKDADKESADFQSRMAAASGEELRRQWEKLQHQQEAALFRTAKSTTSSAGTFRAEEAGQLGGDTPTKKLTDIHETLKEIKDFVTSPGGLQGLGQAGIAAASALFT